METPSPSLAQLVAGIDAGIRARADELSGKAHWAAPVVSVRVLILALLASIIGRLADLCARWEAGLLTPQPAPVPRRRRVAAPRHPHAPALSWPRTRTLPASWPLPPENPVPEPVCPPARMPAASAWPTAGLAWAGQGMRRTPILPAPPSRAGPSPGIGLREGRPRAP